MCLSIALFGKSPQKKNKTRPFSYGVIATLVFLKAPKNKILNKMNNVSPSWDRKVLPTQEQMIGEKTTIFAME